MSFIDSLKERLEIELGQDVNEVSKLLNTGNPIDNIKIFKKLLEFKTKHCSLSNEIIEEALDLKKGKISDAIYNYERYYKGRWRR